jgi:hypothetical protein
MTPATKGLAMVLLAILTLALGAASASDWERAVLSETHRAKDGTLNVQVYTLDASDRAIVCSETLIVRNKPIDVAVGSEVQYTRSGSSLILVDAKGKKHELRIEQEALKDKKSKGGEA